MAEKEDQISLHDWLIVITALVVIVFTSFGVMAAFNPLFWWIFIGSGIVLLILIWGLSREVKRKDEQQK
jgi:ABC-type bacteriocin/lantibiotic exporter with double-glycine peptidase domain